MLRNKYSVAVLGLVLLLVVAYNIAFFRTRTAGKNPEGVAPAPAVTVAPRSKPSPPPQAMTSRPTDAWRRDPFWYPQGTKHAAPAARQGTTTRQSSGIQLEATMLREGKGYAIISGHIVGVGERVGEYVVAEIGDLFVRLKGPGGMKKLSITTDTNVKE